MEGDERGGKRRRADRRERKREWKVEGPKEKSDRCRVRFMKMAKRERERLLSEGVVIRKIFREEKCTCRAGLCRFLCCNLYPFRFPDHLTNVTPTAPLQWRGPLSDITIMIHAATVTLP